MFSILNKLNSSEQIMLAALGKKIQSQGSSSNINFSCIFESNDTKINYNNFKIKLKEGANKSLPLTEEQMQEAFNLLITGELENNVHKTITQLLGRILTLPFQLFRNPLSFSFVPLNLAEDVAIILIKPDNRTIRLAILAYARMNGVNIEEQNLDDLYRYLNTGEKSDFKTLILNGLNTMKDQYGVTDINHADVKLHAVAQSCLDKATPRPKP